MNQQMSASGLNTKIAIVPLTPVLDSMVADLARHHEGAIGVRLGHTRIVEHLRERVREFHRNPAISCVFLIAVGSNEELELARTLQSEYDTDITRLFVLSSFDSLRQALESIGAELTQCGKESASFGADGLRVVITGAEALWPRETSAQTIALLQEVQAKAAGMDWLLNFEIPDVDSKKSLYDCEVVLDLSPICNKYLNQALGYYISLREVEDLTSHSPSDVAQLILDELEKLLAGKETSALSDRSTIWIEK